jgi:ABC-type methionine transport system ATPase subunit
LTTFTKIAVKDLTLALGNNSTLLHNASFNVPAGEIVTLIGPSGSGKSTLLRCLNRLWEPPPGSVFLDGEDIVSLDVLVLRRRVGMVFQSAALFSGNVSDNIAYGPRLHGRVLAEKEIIRLLEIVGLDRAYAHKAASELSGGEGQRVALARTLANEPEVLLLDEPTSALDPAATRHVEEAVLRLRDRLGLTVVWVSHAVEQVRRVADQVVLLVAGQVAETGTPQHLLDGDHHHLTEDFAAGKLGLPVQKEKTS